MDFREWQEKQKKERQLNDESLSVESIFLGRENELKHLNDFLENESLKIFFLYGVPMIGKTTLVKKFSESLTQYQVTRIKLTIQKIQI